jgi:hypothetical protein
MRVLLTAERVRCLRAERHTPLPGDPGIDPAGITTGARGASLKRDVRGAGNARATHRVKRGLD